MELSGAMMRCFCLTLRIRPDRIFGNHRGRQVEGAGSNHLFAATEAFFLSARSVLTLDGHRAAVDLDHKGMAGAVRELESEDEVGDEADLVHGSVV